MDWSNERYVRVYTRDTPEWLILPWQAKALWPLLVRKFDRSGVIATRLGARGVAVLVGLPLDVVEPGLAALLDDGCLQKHDLGYLAPNFIEAQETPQSDANRKRESRERRRALSRTETPPNPVIETTECHTVSREVTSGHAVSQVVTPIPDQTRPDPDPEDLPPARAIPPAPVPSTKQEPTLDQLWGELESERQRLAGQLGVELAPLLAHDSGRADLANALVDATSRGKRAELAKAIRHAIAVAAAEAEAEPERLQWFTGAIFRPNNLRRLSSSTVDQTRRQRAGPRGQAVGRAEPKRPEDYREGDQKL